MYGELQRMIEILVRVVLRGIWGQEERLDFLPVLFEPRCDDFP